MKIAKARINKIAERARELLKLWEDEVAGPLSDYEAEVAENEPTSEGSRHDRWLELSDEVATLVSCAEQVESEMDSTATALDEAVK